MLSDNFNKIINEVKHYWLNFFDQIQQALPYHITLGSSSMNWKFNSNHFTFLSFENPSSGSKVMTYFMTTLTRCGQTDRQTNRQTNKQTDKQT